MLDIKEIGMSYPDIDKLLASKGFVWDSGKLYKQQTAKSWTITAYVLIDADLMNAEIGVSYTDYEISLGTFFDTAIKAFNQHRNFVATRKEHKTHHSYPKNYSYGQNYVTRVSSKYASTQHHFDFITCLDSYLMDADDYFRDYRSLLDNTKITLTHLPQALRYAGKTKTTIKPKTLKLAR